MLPIALGVLAFFLILIILTGFTQVNQSREFVVERLGKYDRTLKAGYHFLFPIFDRIHKKVEVLEVQIPETVPVITKDNVLITLHCVVFYRVVDAAKSVYRIQDLPSAIRTTVISIIRAACGLMEFDEIQGHREQISDQIRSSLLVACEIWGVEITRTEILDVEVPKETQKAMELQLNSERERRAAVTMAEGQRDARNFVADSELYAAQKEAEARRLRADAEAYATSTVAEAISRNGQSAINFEIAKLQVQGWTDISKSSGAKLIIIPTDISKSLGSLAAMFEAYKDMK
jgi:regulator of protease activity HflC (stomatin/prohibitin superfamily)